MRYRQGRKAVCCLIAIIIYLILSGCGGGRYAAEPANTRTQAGGAESGSGGKARLVFLGELYEAPLFAAVEKGFFEEEGLEVELVREEPEHLYRQVSQDGADGALCDGRIFREIAEGAGIKLVAGLHSGCLQILAQENSGLKNLKDLKNKSIGVEALGNGPMTVAAALLRSNGIDPAGEVEWKELAGDIKEAALTAGAADAVACWEPTGEEGEGGAATRVLYSASGGDSGHSHGSGPYQHFYESFIGLSERLIEGEPERAAAVARALLRATDWVSENTEEAVRLAVDNEYVDGDYEYNARLMGCYMWMPGVRNAQNNIKTYIKEQKALSILEPSLDENDFFNKVYVQIIPDLKGR